MTGRSSTAHGAAPARSACEHLVDAVLERQRCARAGEGMVEARRVEVGDTVEGDRPGGEERAGAVGRHEAQRTALRHRAAVSTGETGPASASVERPAQDLGEVVAGDGDEAVDGLHDELLLGQLLHEGEGEVIGARPVAVGGTALVRGTARATP